MYGDFFWNCVIDLVYNCISFKICYKLVILVYIVIFKVFFGVVMEMKLK